MRQASWEQPAPPSRSGASSTSQREESSAFQTQFEEIERAMDNLMKSGKMYPGGPRRDAPPAMYGAHGGAPPRMHGGRHSNYYAAQRYQGRPSETDQMMQAKRRMAAQRERELRNYHQEQQYNRSLLAEMASNKSDRSGSPSTLSEEGRRELIARQHRALYGPEGSNYSQGQYNQDGTSHEQGQQAGPGAMRGSSPRGMDPFGMSGQSDNNQQQSHDSKTTSPPNHQHGKAPSPTTAEESNHSRTISKSTTAPISGSMGPIGSRPNAQHMPGQSLNKRTTSPLPSSLNYGFGNTEQGNDRINTSSNITQDKNTPSVGAWGTGSGVWGNNKLGAGVWS